MIRPSIANLILVGLLFVLTISTFVFADTGSQMSTFFNRVEGRWVAEMPNGSKIIEAWWRSEAGAPTGVGFTINAEGDTSAFEMLDLVEIEGRLNYVADVPHNNGPIHFYLNSSSGDSTWEFLNPDHDFPKRIRYEFSQNYRELAVIVDDNGTSGKGFQLDFERKPHPAGQKF